MNYPYRGLYRKNDDRPWKISRSKIELFKQCPRCFWLEAILGIKRPSTPPFLINSAIDELFKNEFDMHRAKGTKHPLQKEFKIDAKPAKHDQIDVWRENFRGVQYLHEPTNLYVFGAIDDLWINKHDEYIVVDYKATGKHKKVDKLDDSKWHDSYRRQMEVYQWLLRKNDLKVSDLGYFVYANVNFEDKKFDNLLKFDTHVIEYKGNDDWVEPILTKIKQALETEKITEVGDECEHCAYAKGRTLLTLEALGK